MRLENNTTNPLISVILPVYNCEAYIFEAVNSILQQTYAHFELIIIDDCSTDQTLEICKSFQDKRLVILEKKQNSGIAHTMNLGLSVAKGKYVARMDGDDISLPKRFEKQLAFMEANPAVVACGTGYKIMGGTNDSVLPEGHEAIKIRLLYGNCIVHPSVMVRKAELTTAAILYDPTMEPAEDYDFWVKFLAVGQLHNLQEELLHYRVHSAQASSVKQSIQAESSKKIRFKLLHYLKANITIEEQRVYFKAMEDAKELTTKEFFILQQLKKKMIKANSTHFFEKKGFKKYWSVLMRNYKSASFKNRMTYSLAQILGYLIPFKK